LTLTARILKLAYQLRYHCLGGWALDRWLMAGVLAGAGLSLLRGSWPARWQGWLMAGLLILLAGGLLWLRRWAAGQQHVIFTPQPEPPPTGQALDPTDKILIRATGRFEVEGKSHFFVELLAYWRTFATREHAVMAIVHKSRFLWLARRPEDELGMWYIFFRPEEIETITPGLLTFGTIQRLALRVQHRSAQAGTGTSDRKPRRPAPPLTDTTHLTFDDDATRRRVWADLLAESR